MSEYQYIEFRAIDGPVSEKNLKFMRQQSSRAEITPWSFTNEYHFGDFRGDALEMLRRGYDMHFHYANFGIRTLLIRLPQGLPDPIAAKAYFDEDSLTFLKDKHGRGGILCIDPGHEPDDLDELWDPQSCLDELLSLRAELLEGDLRPLYLARLAVASDMNHDPEETTEGPVPAGLGKLSGAQKALAGLYELSDALIKAAARKSPPLPDGRDSHEAHLEWLHRQPEAVKDAWLAKWMTDPHSTARREIQDAFHESQEAPSWPTVPGERTVAELKAAAVEVQRKTDRKSAEKAAHTRAKRLTEMAADPTPTLRKSEKLVAQRSRDAYEEIASLLADLRDALIGSDRADLAEQQAQKLKSKHPTLKMLVSELRRKGFLQK